MVKRQARNSSGSLSKKKDPSELEENATDFFDAYESSNDSDHGSEDLSEDDFAAETPAEKRVRLAKQYLTSISDEKGK